MKRIYLLIIPILFMMLPSCHKEEISTKEPVDPREIFLGTWKATDRFTDSNGTIVTQTFNFTIEKSAEDNYITIQGFANLGGSGLQSEVVSSKFKIPLIEVTVNGMPADFSATGDLLNEKLTYQYTITSPSFNRVYTGSAVK